MKKPFIYSAVIGVSSLLSSCQPIDKILLYNNTDQAITVESTEARKTLIIAPGGMAYTGSSLSALDDAGISQAGKTYYYRLAGLIIPNEYQEGRSFGRIARVKFASDHRIYVLPTAKSPERLPATQPAGFPLAPHYISPRPPVALQPRP